MTPYFLLTLLTARPPGRCPSRSHCPGCLSGTLMFFILSSSFLDFIGNALRVGCTIWDVFVPQHVLGIILVCLL